MGAEGDVAPRFKPGDLVAVRRAEPPGHIRTPWYIRGQTGVVDRLWGAFANPEELAYHRPGLPKQPLYRIRFRQGEVWPAYRGGAQDTLFVDIYQHWLDPA